MDFLPYSLALLAAPAIAAPQLHGTETTTTNNILFNVSSTEPYLEARGDGDDDREFWQWPSAMRYDWDMFDETCGLWRSPRAYLSCVIRLPIVLFCCSYFGLLGLG